MKVAGSFRALAALSGIASSLAVFTNSSTGTNSSSIDSESPPAPILGDGTVDLGIAEAAYEKAKALVAKMTNAQKVQVINGESVTGLFTGLNSHDGIAGVNQDFFVSGFAEPMATTMTWNRTLYEAHSRALGDEFYGTGYSLVQGPVASPLGRDPYGGRLPEGFSPEPYLSGIMMGIAVAAINSAGVVTTGRHYLLNEQETNRNDGGYSANANDKTINEVYLWPFADAVKNGLMGVMCGMNKVNQSFTCESDKLLNGYLKTNVGFPGLVLPDVGSQHTSYGSANAGLDRGGMGYWSESVILAGIKNGELSQARLDDMAIRNIIGWYYVGLDNGKQPKSGSSTVDRNVRGNHSTIIRQVGREALVLVKNDNTGGGGLPLNKPKTVALFGAHAGPVMAGPNQGFSVGGTPSDIYQGHLATACGSGDASLPYLITPFEVINTRVADEGGMVWWVLNNTYTPSAFSGFPGGGGGGGGGGGFPGGPGGNNNSVLVPRQGPGGGGHGGGPGGGFNSGTGATPSIPNYAQNAEVCIAFINSWSGEGGDRKELANADQDTLITTVAKTCNNTIVVGNFAGPRVLDAWIENPNVTAVLYSGLLGQESGRAIGDVLFGDVNPSGKLTHTVAKLASDYPTPTCLTTQCNYTEGVYLDYRYFQAEGVAVRYPFGHGLSYTTFTYGGVTAAITNKTAVASKYPTGHLSLGGQTDLFDEVISVKTTVKNSGAVDGAEVAQLYISFPKEAAQPVRVLRGFEKVNIAAGQTADVTFSVRRKDISHWDNIAQLFAIASGEYTLSVGSSSEDLRGNATLTI
ncbi:putative beta-glucosidase D [Xylariales sp. AK1849]|nr:putative beta-glucosidase D [Xylariales sp. AK1849]